MTKHLKFGGSTAARTVACPAWINLAEEMPKRVEGSNPAADLGTLLHNCMEAHVLESMPFEEMLTNAWNYRDQVLNQELIDTKLIPAQEALTALESLYDIAEFDCEPFVQVDLDIGGSIDYIGVSNDGKTVVIADYKFGYNQVEAKNNAQLMFYALCARTDAETADLFEKCEHIVLAIIQPSEEFETLDVDIVTVKEIQTFASEFITAVERAEDPDAKPCAGDHCTYCPAITICPEKTGAALLASRLNPLQLDTLSDAMLMVKDLKEWIKAVEKQAHEQLELGQAVKGFKLVNKRASRVWNNPEAVGEKIRRARNIKLEEGFDLKLKSPAQLEKVCKAKGNVDFKQYDKYISAISSGTTLAPESDKRPAVLAVAGLEQLNKLN